MKRANPGALAVLGFGKNANIAVAKTKITPKSVQIGGKLTMVSAVTNINSKLQRVLVDLRLHFIKANGKTKPKIFKLKIIKLAAHQIVSLQKTVSVAEMTTRKHYPGTHKVEVVLNGVAQPLGKFELTQR